MKHQRPVAHPRPWFQVQTQASRSERQRQVDLRFVADPPEHLTVRVPFHWIPASSEADAGIATGNVDFFQSGPPLCGYWVRSFARVDPKQVGTTVLKLLLNTCRWRHITHCVVTVDPIHAVPFEAS